MIQERCNSLVDILQQAAEGTSGITFILASDKERCLCYDELRKNALHVLHNLTLQGLQPGDELVMQIEDNALFLTVFWACLYGKIIPVPIAMGSQEGHKDKLFNVWSTLHHPFLLSEDNWAAPARSYAEEKDCLPAWEEMRTRHIPVASLTAEAGSGTYLSSAPEDIAYIQFSSGSTSHPKGVTLTHGNLLANISDIRERSATTAADKALSWLPLTHDMGLICFHLSCVIAGIDQYLIATPLFIRRPLLWMEKAHQHRITQLYSPNFGYQYILAALSGIDRPAWNLEAVRIIYNGAEPINKSLCEDFMRVMSSFGLREHTMFPGYGLAEACVAVTLPTPGEPLQFVSLDRNYLQTGDRVRYVPDRLHFACVGYPMASTSIAITNDQGEWLEDDHIGNIWISGHNVTSGYYNNPEASSRAIENGWLKTGDLGFISEGRLYITGRAKNIIIINGQNYYPQDIEHHAQIPGIKPGDIVACQALPAGSDKHELVLFVHFRRSVQEFHPLVIQLRAQLLAKLGIVPDRIVMVKSVPRTTSGKVQHYLLVQQFERGDYDSQLEALAMLDRAYYQVDEDTVKALVQEVFSVSGDPDEDFFRNGLNSLEAVRLVSRLRAAGFELTVREVFEHHTIRSLQRYLLEKEHSGANTIPVAAANALYELSVGQRRFWHFCQLEGASVAANIASGAYIQGQLSAEAFIAAFARIVSRHESLRTVFVVQDGEVYQRVLTAEEIGFRVEVMDPGNEADPLSYARAAALEQAATAFDLYQGPLLRVTLFKLSATEYYFAFVIHHLVSDGWSIDVISRELEQLYTGGGTDVLPALRIQYKDYLSWSRERILQADYWSSLLSGVLPGVDLSIWGGHRNNARKGHIVYYHLDAAIVAGLSGISHEVTLFTTLLSAFSILLHRYTGQSELMLSTDSAGRTHPELEEQVGYYLQLLPLRFKIEGGTRFRDYQRSVHEQLLDAYAYQESSEQVLSGLYEPGIYDILFLYQHFNGFSRLGEGLKVTTEDLDNGSSLNAMQLECWPSAEGITLKLRYDISLFGEWQMSRLLEHYSYLCTAIAASPDATLDSYDIVSAGERERLLSFNPPSEAVTGATITKLISRNQGAAVAIRDGDTTLSYAALESASNRLAHYLRSTCGVGAGSIVGVLAGRSASTAIALLGILKSGAAYLPIDTDYPVERIRYMLEDSGAVLLLSDSAMPALNCRQELLSVDLSSYADSYPDWEISGSDTAYVIYTSGSTGQPKGVQISHTSLTDYAETFSTYFGVSSTDVVLHQSSLSFDTAVEELYPVLIAGGELVIAPEGGKAVSALCELMCRYKVTLLSTTPLVIGEINQGAYDTSSLRVLISGGDELRPGQIDRLPSSLSIYNTYGPSESTVCATYHKISDRSKAGLLGRPIRNRAVYIMDAQGRLQPAGVRGEIVLGGTGISKGYLHREALTQERFIPNQYGAGMLYRTGDQGWWTAEGELVFGGRVDTQLKLRGYRIEPGEIAHVLQGYAGIESSVVVPVEIGGVLQLVGYYSGETVKQEALRSYLLSLLPWYMVPAHLVCLDQLPRTVNGKIDRERLPMPVLSETALPEGAHEVLLATIWSEELGVSPIHRGDSFFALGGHSLSAVRVLSRVYEQTGIRLELRDLFLHPALQAQALLLKQREQSGYQPIPVVAAGPQYALSPGQRRIWLSEATANVKTAFNIAKFCSLSYEQDFDEQAFINAFSAIVSRHESLRTVFVVQDGEVYQRVLTAEEIGFNVAVVDLSNEADPLSVARAAALEHASTAFDLYQGPLLRVTLFKLSATEYYFAFVIHHLVSDGWSIDVISRELEQLYTGGGRDTLPALRIQYKDYLSWSPERVLHANHWSSLLSGVLPVTDLSVWGGHRNNARKGHIVYHHLHADIVAGLSGISREVTLFTTLLSAFSILLHRYTGQSELLLSTDSAGRTHPELEEQVGYYLQLLPLRFKIDGDTHFRDYQRSVHEQLLDAYAYQESSEQVLSGLHEPGIYDILFLYQDFSRKNNQGLKVTTEDLDNGSSLNAMQLECWPSAEGITLKLRYDISLFGEWQMSRLLEHYSYLCTAIAASPDATLDSYDIVSAGERERLLSFNPPSEAVTGATITKLISRNQGAAVAIRDGDTTLSYAALESASNRLAHYLRSTCGVGAGSIVGVLAGRSASTAIALLGILKSGAAYLPIDTDYPVERIRYMLEDSGAVLLLSDSAMPALNCRQELLSADLSAYADSYPDWEISGSDTAYVIYTSGSTGQPKGVQISHASLTDYAETFSTYFGVSSTDVVLHQSSLSFDTAVEELYPVLVAGGELVIAPEGGKAVSALCELMCRYKVTVLSTTPLVIGEINQGAYDTSSLRVLISGGDELRPGQIDRLPSSLSIYNTYGPSESTVCATYHKINDRSRAGLLGRPIRNRAVYIMDAQGRLQPAGVRGEIVLGGTGISKGYLHREALTQERFIPNQYGAGMLYRTGDQGWWTAEGELVFGGRVDTQLKLRGYRIEPGEIAHVLQGYAGIESSVVVPVEIGGVLQLVGYYSGETVKQEALRSYLLSLLPWYMVPAHLVCLDQLPRTVNGKIDRERLPMPVLSETALPEGAHEVLLATIWSEELGVSPIHRGDNFFALGGHSLSAVRVLSRVYEQTGIRLELRDLFLHPALQAQALLLQQREQSGYQPIPVVAQKEYYTLSHAQQRLWVLDQFKEVAVAYNIHLCYRLKGFIDVPLLEAAFRYVIGRHESLRTRFVNQHGIPYQQLVDIPFELAYADLSALADKERLVLKAAEEAVITPFDLEEGPLLRACIWQLEAEAYVFVLVLHHIIADEWSMGILMEELLTVYNAYREGDQPALSDLTIQYKDYSAWQEAVLQGERAAAAREYWTQLLHEPLPLLSMPTDRQREPVMTHQGERIDMMIPVPVFKTLQHLLREENSSLFMGLLSLVYVLLYRYSGQTDIIVGTPVAGRDHPALKDQIGFYVNLLALRMQVDMGLGFTGLLRKVKALLLDAYTHQEYPFDGLLKDLSLKRDLSHSPLFDVMMVLHDGRKSVGLKDISATEIKLATGFSKFDLTFSFAETDEALSLTLEYNTALFDKERIQQLGNHFIQLAAAFTTDPDCRLMDAEMLSQEEQYELLETFSGPAAIRSEETLVSRFEAQVRRTPQQIAYRDDTTQLTYKALSYRSAQLARYLVSAVEVRPKERVALIMNRSEWLITGMLGVLKAGATYLPVDATMPVERIRYMLADAGVKVALSAVPFSCEGVTVLPADIYWEELKQDWDIIIPEAADPAYVIYTSGSSGRPKGVMVSHASIVQLCDWHQTAFQVHTGSRATLFAGVSFDASGWEIWPYLLNGATLYRIPDTARGDMELLAGFLTTNDISHCFLPTAVCRTLLNSGVALHTELTLLTGGEALGHVPVPVCKLYNNYGPTESTVVTTSFPVRAATKGAVPIGKPIAGRRVYILDEHMHLQPVGVNGRLYIAGEGLALAYLGQPALTAARFISNPFHGGLMYDSGDTGRWLPDGNIVFTGRADEQVKIRGNRVEPAETAHLLMQYEQIEEAVVCAFGNTDDVFLAAYYVGPEDISPQVLRTYLQYHLPEYMIPAYFTRVAFIPLTVNGKTDRDALPAPVPLTTDFTAPRNETEERLATIWQDVLGLARVGIDDNFFLLGGHSLKAIQVLSRIHKEFSIKLELSSLFQHPRLSDFHDELAVLIWAKRTQTNVTTITNPTKIDEIVL
ncbi:non-ribosomal peptide synthetase [Chitinophaga filiformis]|uniref:Amino acid adenylation domain-containing protein n=1 Tax=Chitinophaga filiformis TaxID=104663 RepID=A0ABY4I8J7_CHIFI|nr:non-ribosomal peptide synthetase [Chitinophaga filiformis]UPK71694.1 amino acid adenylation domain-containing protein [Chitinophaga filiformis]